MKAIAKFVSIILHPLLMPFYIILILLLFSPVGILLSPRAILIISSIVFLTTCFIPLLFALLMKKLEEVKTLSMRERKERRVPLFFTASMSFLCYLLMARIPRLHELIPKLFLALTLFLLILLVITNFWKISLHMAAMGGLLAVVLLFSFSHSLPYFIILLSGLVGTSRLYLRVHNSSQVYIGFILGFSFFFVYFS